jgi:hypothetical protein
MASLMKSLKGLAAYYLSAGEDNLYVMEHAKEVRRASAPRAVRRLSRIRLMVSCMMSCFCCGHGSIRPRVASCTGTSRRFTVKCSPPICPLGDRCRRSCTAFTPVMVSAEAKIPSQQHPSDGPACGGVQARIRTTSTVTTTGKVPVKWVIAGC